MRSYVSVQSTCFKVSLDETRAPSFPRFVCCCFSSRQCVSCMMIHSQTNNHLSWTSLYKNAVNPATRSVIKKHTKKKILRVSALSKSMVGLTVALSWKETSTHEILQINWNTSGLTALYPSFHVDFLTWRLAAFLKKPSVITSCL